MRRDIITLIELAHDRGLRVDLQTNAVLLDRRSPDRLLPMLSRLGLSLDGEDAATHGQMRGSSTNFRQVIHALELAEACGIPTTVRTLVTRVNRGHLAGIADVIGQFKCVEKWSLREFAPLGRGETTQNLYSLMRAEFLAECRAITEHLPRRAAYPLAIVTTEEMEHCFCLISEEGFVYGHPVGGMYQSYGHFPEERLAPIIQRLQYDAQIYAERNRSSRSLPLRLAPTP
jgi:MoaA/NifB/PqqE/SkfB family radical SAM enzyme